MALLPSWSPPIPPPTPQRVGGRAQLPAYAIVVFCCVSLAHIGAGLIAFPDAPAAAAALLDDLVAARAALDERGFVMPPPPPGVAVAGGGDAGVCGGG